MQEQKLYLVFEFLKMDLKKYMDTFRSGTMIDPELVKVWMDGISGWILLKLVIISRPVCISQNGRDIHNWDSKTE